MGKVLWFFVKAVVVLAAIYIIVGIASVALLVDYAYIQNGAGQ